MGDFGARLKQAREVKGVSLREIATATKISMSVLEALERDDFARLPGGIFSRAFVREYAIHAGLDPDRTVEEFVAALEQHERDAARAAPRREVTPDDREFLARQQRAARILRAVIIAFVVLVVGLLMWRFWSHRQPGPAAPSRNASAPAPPAPSAIPPPAVVSPPPQGGEAPPATAPESDKLALSVEVTGPCWVQVTSDGSVVLSKILQAGEHQAFEADHEVYVQVGNAGVFTWTINGRPGKPLGKPGQAAYVKVTPGNFREFLK